MVLLYQYKGKITQHGVDFLDKYAEYLIKLQERDLTIVDIQFKYIGCLQERGVVQNYDVDSVIEK